MEALRPVHVLLAQFAYISQPTLRMIIPESRILDIARLFEDGQTMDELITLISESEK
ncbi:MAG: hypothetical protein JXA19_06705 [Anaerolineales bacterium]|nr:hypothetical protein [Anaerolineales bacterium]